MCEWMKPDYPLAGQLQLFAGVKFDHGAAYDEDDRHWTDDLDAAQVVTSLAKHLGQGSPEHPDWKHWHLPVIDIDLPVYAVPSTTPGHSHLYIDKLLVWDDYVKLLLVLADVGIVEPGFVSASESRGFTSVRLPWVRK